MEASLQEQLIAIAYSTVFGGFLGAIYDLISAIGYIFNFKSNDYLLKKQQAFKKQTLAKKICLFLLDLLYFIVVTPFVAIFLYGVNNGIVRWYLILGGIIGVAIYKITIGRLISVLIINLSQFIRHIFLKALIPIKLLSNRLKKIKIKVKKKETNKKKVMIYVSGKRKQQG